MLKTSFKVLLRGREKTRITETQMYALLNSRQSELMPAVSRRFKRLGPS